MRLSEKRFLVSGEPRCRTAWLTALLNAHGFLTYHDPLTFGVPILGEYGVCDPALALGAPKSTLRHFLGSPVVCLYSDDPLSNIMALMAVYGGKTTLLEQTRSLNNLEYFKSRVEYLVHVDELEDNEKVANLVTYLTGKPADHRLITIFQGLLITQHVEKAYANCSREYSESGASDERTASDDVPSFHFGI